MITYYIGKAIQFRRYPVIGGKYEMTHFIISYSVVKLAKMIWIQL